MNQLRKIINLVNEHMRDEGQIGFPRIVDGLPAKMEPQSSELEGVDTEWVWQQTDQFDCYHGEIAFRLTGGKFLIFEFCG